MDVRFVLENVQAGAGDLPLLQKPDQGFFIHHFAARGVDQEGRGFHEGEVGSPDQMLGFGAEGDVQAEEVGLAKQSRAVYKVSANSTLTL